MLTPFQTSLKLECRPKGLRGCGREGSPWTAVGDGTPKGTRAGRAGRRPSPVTPFFSLHRGCRRPHGGLLCRRTSHGHSAQGLLTAIRLELQGMQVRLPVATAAPGWRALGGNAGRKGQRVPGPPRGRVSGDRPGCGRSGGRAAPASLLRAPTDPVLASDCPLRRESWQCSSLCSAGTVAESVSS